MNTIVSLKYLCRFCGNFNQNNRNLFFDTGGSGENNEQKMFVNKICLVFHTLVLENDHFPKYICRKCEDFANLAYEKRKIFEQCQKHWITTTSATPKPDDDSQKDDHNGFLDKLQQIKEGTAQIENILDSHLSNFKKLIDPSQRTNNHHVSKVEAEVDTSTSSCNILKKLLTENVVYNARTLKRICIDYFNDQGPDLLETYLKVTLPPLSTDDEDDDDDDEEDNVPLIRQITKVAAEPAPKAAKKRKKYDKCFIRNVTKKRRRKERINYAEDYPDELLFRSFDSSKGTPSPVTVKPAVETNRTEAKTVKSHEEVKNKVTELFKVNPASIIQINSAVSIALKAGGSQSPTSAGRSLSISSNSSFDLGSDKAILNGSNATSATSIKLKINIPEQRIVPNQQTTGDGEFAKQMCKKCGIWVATLKDLAVHQATHLKVRLRNLNTRKLLRPSQRRGKCVVVQNQRYLRCMNCLKTYATVISLKLHWVNRRCNYYCKICGLSFRENPLQLGRHIRTQHGITQDLNRNLTVSRTPSEPSSSGSSVTVTKVLAPPRPAAAVNINLKSMEKLTNNLPSPSIPGVRIVKRQVPATETAEDPKREILNQYMNKMTTATIRAPTSGYVTENGVTRIGNLTIRPTVQKHGTTTTSLQVRPMGSRVTCPVCMATFANNQLRAEHMKCHRAPTKVGAGESSRIFVNSSTMGGGRMLDSQKLKILAQNQQQRIDQQKKLQQSLQRIKQIKLGKQSPQPPGGQPSPQQQQPRLQPISTSLLLKHQLQQKQQQQQQQQQQNAGYPMASHTISVPPLAMLQPQIAPQGPNMGFGQRRLVPIMSKPQQPSPSPYFNGPPQPQHSPQPPVLAGFGAPPAAVAPPPDICQLCGAQFYNKAEFFVHKQQCTDQSQQQTCPYCYKLFLTASDLQMHIMCIHPEVEN